MTSSSRNKAFWLYVIALCVTFVVFLVLIALEAYVRWTLNQNFGFLNGQGLLSLAILAVGQFAGLAYLLKD